MSEVCNMRFGILPSGMVTTTKSHPRGTSATDPGFAPVSFAKSTRVSGPRELATTTSCSSRVKCRVRVAQCSQYRCSLFSYSFSCQFSFTASEPPNLRESRLSNDHSQVAESHFNRLKLALQSGATHTIDNRRGDLDQSLSDSADLLAPLHLCALALVPLRFHIK